MQIFASCLAWGPPAIYLLVLGVINWRARPLVVRGGRETAALGLALAGCVLVGPAQLLATPEALARFGGGVWALLGLVYALVVVLLILLAPPRLVIYNARREDVRAVLDRLAAQSDVDGRWAGSTLLLERWGIELHLDDFAPLASVSLVALGPQQSDSGWRQLERCLRSALAEVRPTGGRRGLLLAILGALVLACLSIGWPRAPPRQPKGCANSYLPSGRSQRATVSPAGGC